MVSTISINKGMKFVISNQRLIFGGYVKVRESLYTSIAIRPNTILNHIDIRVILSRCKDSCMEYRPY